MPVAGHRPLRRSLSSLQHAPGKCFFPELGPEGSCRPGFFLIRAAKDGSPVQCAADSTILHAQVSAEEVTIIPDSPLPAVLGGGFYHTLNEGRVIGTELAFRY